MKIDKRSFYIRETVNLIKDNQLDTENTYNASKLMVSEEMLKRRSNLDKNVFKTEKFIYSAIEDEETILKSAYCHALSKAVFVFKASFSFFCFSNES